MGTHHPRCARQRGGTRRHGLAALALLLLACLAAATAAAAADEGTPSPPSLSPDADIAAEPTTTMLVGRRRRAATAPRPSSRRRRGNSSRNNNNNKNLRPVTNTPLGDDGPAVSGFLGPALETAAETTPSPPASSFDDRADIFVSAMDPLYGTTLTNHNSYRATHRAPALVWDDAAASRAKITADTCRFEHYPQGDGENLAYTTNPDLAASLAWAVKAWYDEVQYYNYASPGFSSQTGHFTQVVWKASARLGCYARRCAGMASGRDASYVVCHYAPPGNVQGQFAANVSF
jgi:glioma pathogenesis-related protein 2